MPRVYVSIGSNQDRERNVRNAVADLRERFQHLVLSSVYDTDAVGFSGDPFFNLVAGFDTQMSLEQVITELHAIEERAGRVRDGKRFGPRAMDIDVLTYDDVVAEEVDVPRGEITEQAYVLRPLAEIAPNERHPTLGETFADLEARLALPTAGMRRIACDLTDEARRT